MRKIRGILIILLMFTIGVLGITQIEPKELLSKVDSTPIYAYNHKPDNILDNTFLLDNGTRIIPFIFEDSDKTITKDFLLNEFDKKGLNVINKDKLKDIIVTGDEIETKSRKYTVLIYGDVDANGKVDVFDAGKVLRHSVYGEEHTLTGIYELAGDVYNIGDTEELLDVFDAGRILRFSVGIEPKLVLNEPDASTIPDEPEKEKPTYIVPTGLKATYGQTLADVKLPEGFKFEDNLNKVVGNVGTNTFKVTYTPKDTNKYEIVTGIEVIITVEKAVPTASILPENIKAKYGDLLINVTLPEGWTFDNITKTTTVGDVGTNTFKVTYTPKDTNNYELVYDEVTIIVGKAIPTAPTLPESVKAEYGDLLSSITLPEGWTFDDITENATVGNAGTNTFKVTYTPKDSEKYELIHDDIIISVDKINPDTSTLPESVTAKEGDLLKEIVLPEGWAFDNITDIMEVGAVNLAGTEYAVTFTPDDTNNYNLVNDTIKVIVEEETEKVVGLVDVSNKDEKIYRYEKIKPVATIKSSNSVLIENTSDFIINANIVTKPDDAEASYVSVEPNTENGLFDIKLYAVKAGNYTIEVTLKGNKVKREVKLKENITAEINENYEVTKVDIKTNNNPITTENPIDVKVNKEAKIQLVYSHEYKDENNNILDTIVIPENELMHTKVTLNCVNDRAIAYIGQGENWIDDVTGNKIAPTEITIRGKRAGDEILSINIKNSSEYENREVNPAPQVSFAVQTRAKIKDIVIDYSAIDLYTYDLDYTTIQTDEGSDYKYALVEQDGKTYTVIKDGDKVYTLFPLKAKDTDDDEMKLQAKDIKVDADSVGEDENWVIVYENGSENGESEDIDIKGFTLGGNNNNYYQKQDLTMSTEIDAIGIAWNKPNDLNQREASIERISQGITIYHNKIEGNQSEPAHETPITVNVIKEKISGIRNSGQQALPPHYRYTTSPIVTIESTNENTPLMNDETKGCVIEGKVVDSPEGATVDISTTPVTNGVYDITLYATKAGEYKIMPIAKGFMVKDGEVQLSEPINVTVEENYQVTDYEIKLDNEVIQSDEAINIKIDSEIEPTITFSHVYKDENGTILDTIPIPDDKLNKTKVELLQNGQKVTSSVCYENVALIWDENKKGYKETTTSSNIYTYGPNCIKIEGKSVGETVLTVKVTNDSKYDYLNNNVTLPEKQIKLNVIIRGISNLQVKDTSIDLYDPGYNLPYKTVQTDAGDNSTYAEVEKDGRKYTVVKDEDGIVYTILELKDIKDRDGATLQLKHNQIQQDDDSKTEPEYVVFFEEASDDASEDIIVHGFKVLTTQDGKKAYKKTNQADYVDVIGIAWNKVAGEEEDAKQRLEGDGINVYYNKIIGNNTTLEQATIPLTVNVIYDATSASITATKAPALKTINKQQITETTNMNKVQENKDTSEKQNTIINNIINNAILLNAVVNSNNVIQ